MKTMVLLILFTTGMIWPTIVNTMHHGGKTVIYKNNLGMPTSRVSQWNI